MLNKERALAHRAPIQVTRTRTRFVLKMSRVGGVVSLSLFILLKAQLGLIQFVISYLLKLECVKGFIFESTIFFCISSFPFLGVPLPLNLLC